MGGAACLRFPLTVGSDTHSGRQTFTISITAFGNPNTSTTASWCEAPSRDGQECRQQDWRCGSGRLHRQAPLAFA